LTHNPILKAYY